MSQTFHLSVNGRDVRVDCEADTPLLSVLRNDLGLLGSRFGCGLAQCGACFVQVEAHVVPACDTPMWSVAGASVTTVEGLSGAEGELHPVQQALLDHQAAQCGFCISGIAVRAAALLRENPTPDAAEVCAALERNLCRCGAHGRIVRAVLAAGRADGRARDGSR